ncbi:TPA: hypothetical protein ACH3X1_014044 [Trebouxia sp. C0004]
MANMTMRMQVKVPVVCAGAHASLRVQRARPMRLSAFQGLVAPARLSANCNLFATQQSFGSLTDAQIRSPSSRSLRSVVCMAAKKSVSDLKKADLEGKVVLVRADLNVPLDKNQKITDDTRIRAAIPTLKYLTDNGARVLLTSHLGRPKDGPEDKFRLTPVVPRLSELLGTKVLKADDCIGEEVKEKTQALKNGEVLVLENVRFYKEETKNDPGFAEKLAANADIFVNDAFGTAHRAHASTEGVTKFLHPSVAGLLLQKELDYLDGAVREPKRPFVAIVGGSKVSSKIGVIESLLEKTDKIILGLLKPGSRAQTLIIVKDIATPQHTSETQLYVLQWWHDLHLLQSPGMSVGSSLVEEDKLDLAKKLEASAKEKGVEFILPTDVIAADRFDENAETQVVAAGDIPDGWMGLDIGPDSLKAFQGALADAKTIIWNGPMGVFEFEKFAKGTFGVAETLAELTGKGAITIIGGGDSVAAVEQAGLADKMSHISTGGGASLELLEGKVLPGVAALDEKSAGGSSSNGNGGEKTENADSYQDPLDVYCEDNPETDECRVYDN